MIHIYRHVRFVR